MATDPRPRSRFLPPTGSRVLLAAVLAFAALAAYFAVTSAAEFAASGGTFSLTMALVWLAVGIGMWRLHPMARSVAMILLTLYSVVLVLGAFSPFMASDVAAATGQPPNPWRIAAWVVPVAVLFVALLWIFEKHKHEFRRP